MANKDLLKAKTRENFYVLGSIIRDAIKARDAYRARLAEIDKQRDMLLPERIGELKVKARADHLAAREALWPKASEELEALRLTLAESHAALDLSPELMTAVSLIKSIGPALGGDDIRRINAQFATDQSSLRILQTAYKSAGMKYTGDLDKQVYDAESAVQVIAQRAYASLTKGDSLNSLALEISRVAGLEGFEFDASPDKQGVADSFMIGAGLIVVNSDGSVSGVQNG